MFNCAGLNKKDLKRFEELNRRRKEFNELNENFMDDYNSLGYAFQIFLLKKIKILKCGSDLAGFLWVNSLNKYNTTINAISVIDSVNMYQGFNILISLIKGNSSLNYSCMKNDFNFGILSESGFKKKDGTLELSKHLVNYNNIIYDENISFHVVEKGPLEKIRCELQNEIFKDVNRVPLKMEDIYFDELQNYYLKPGSILMRYKNNYIGYGQVIIEFNNATIVNFGILKKYRNRGFGKELLFHLLNIILIYNYNFAFIKVKSYNDGALNLYKSCGFKILSESYNWVLNR
ncbi:MAG: GNAT family N-acetyltransferase [Clostridiaceae bacterium]|nr:GNAT family N-acetyltransferase [Clostridiaceae bacterium]